MAGGPPASDLRFPISGFLRHLAFDIRPSLLAVAAGAVPQGGSPGRGRLPRYGEGFCQYPDVSERIAFWDEHLRELAALEDDNLPVAYLSEMDQGLYGGLLGGEAQFLSDPATGWISSMVKPLLKDWSGMSGRVAPGDCSPGAPTDPYVQDYRIRFLK